MTKTAYLLLVALAACGAKKPADQPENPDESSDPAAAGSAAPAASDDKALGGDPEAAGAKPTHKDEDAPKKQTPCSGFDVPDLLSVLSQSSCEVPNAAPDAKQRDVKDTLEVQVVPQAAKIAGGSKVDVLVTFKNKGKADLPLDFVVDPEAHFDFEVYTVKGARVDRPAGNEPAFPGNPPQPERHTARITLATNGSAKLTLSFNAVKYAWASKERAKGALPGHGYPREPAGPLAKGKYVLRVITPLTGVFEGTDHEVSQPRAQIEVN